MDFEQTQTIEFWLAEGKSYNRKGRRAVIVRKDRGVKWVIDFDRNSYTEIPLEEEILPAELDSGNLQTAGFYYDPDYEWEIRDTGITENKFGYNCRIFKARGDADYADVESRYWICLDEAHRGGQEFREFMIDHLLDESESESLRRLLADLGTGFPVYWEEAENGPIAPVIIRRLSLTLMESAPGSPGLYELPAGLSRRR